MKRDLRIEKAKGERFLWYLRPPFNDRYSAEYFDHSHWWKSKTVPQLQALYELIRRHPALGELKRQKAVLDQKNAKYTRISCGGLWIQFQLSPETKAMGADTEMEKIVVGQSLKILLFLFDQGFFLRPWSKLTIKERQLFRTQIETNYIGKGRDLTKKAVDIVQEAQSQFRPKQNDLFALEDAITKSVIEHFEHDRLMFAINTDWESKKEAKAALAQLGKIFWKHWKKTAKQTRSRSNDWLNAICDFECDFDKFSGEKIYSAKFRKFVAHFDGL